MKVAVYVRVSTKDKQDINTQICYLSEYAKQRNLFVYRLYRDEGQSGSKTNRPALDELLADMRNDMFDSILVYKLDRFGRSIQHLLKLFNEFKERNIKFISATQNIDTSTPESKMFLHMLMVFAEYEREMIINRIHAGLDRARKEGKKLGRPKGSKDKRKRRNHGYHTRWSQEQQRQKHSKVMKDAFSKKS